MFASLAGSMGAKMKTPVLLFGSTLASKLLLLNVRKKGQSHQSPSMAESIDARMKMPPKVVLIGSTGHGKSAYGNFLLNPTLDHIHKDEKWTFVVGEGRQSCTRVCSRGRSDDAIVMDTPGLNESHRRDLRNMINVVKEANELGEAHAFVLVMKMDSRMDQTYKDTVSFFCDLFGRERFSSRLILVLTNFRQNDVQYSGDVGKAKVQQNKSESSEDVKELLGLAESPPVFCINSRPNDEEDLKVQLAVRKDFLNQARQNPPARLQDLRVPKTEAVKKKHAEEACGLKVSIEGKEEEKREAETLPPSEKQRHMELEKAVAETKKEIEKLEAEIKKRDTEELVPLIAEWEVDVEAGFGKGGDGDGWHFDLKCPCKIREVIPGGSFYPYASFVSFRETEDRVQGHFERARFGCFHRGTLRVDCEGHKRDLYAQEIQKMKTEVKKKHTQKNDRLKEMGQIEQTHRKLKSDTKELVERMEELKSTHFISIKEAEKEAALLEAQSKL